MPDADQQGGATLVPTRIPIVYSPREAEHRILDRADRQIHRVLATSLPDEVKHDRVYDYFTQAGRDLERLAAHRLRVVYLQPRRGGGR